MGLSQAIEAYYNVNAENEPLMIRAYSLQRQNGVKKDKMNLKKAPNRPESYFIALEKGIIPKYFASTYYVCDNEVMMNIIVKAYDLMVKNNFSENDIKNFMHSATEYYNDIQSINISDIESIINDKSIPKEDKIYYIYAKMNAVHHHKPNVEADIINSLKLLKQNPEVVKKGIEPTTLNDETYLILNYDRLRCCKTEEVIKKVLDMKNISDEEKFFRILGEIKKEILKKEKEILKEKENYPEILYQIAETGIMQIGFNDKKAMIYYNDEKVLQDVLSTSKLLIKNKYWKWAKSENGDIFTIAPELCITTKIVQEVLNDKKIPMKDKEEIIARRLYKEKYLAYNENQIKNGFNYNLITDEGFLLIEKGYFPKYFDRISQDKFLFSKKSGMIFNQIIDIYKNKGFGDTHIKNLITCNAIDINIASKISDPNEILKQNLLKIKNNAEWHEFVTAYFDSGLISIDNIKVAEIKNLISDFISKKYSVKDIKSVANLKTIDGFTDDDIQYYVYNLADFFPHIATATEKVLKDSSIKIVDRPLFIKMFAEREYIAFNKSQTYKEFIVAMTEKGYSIDTIDSYLDYDFGLNQKSAAIIIDTLLKNGYSSNKVKEILGYTKWAYQNTVPCEFFEMVNEKDKIIVFNRLLTDGIKTSELNAEGLDFIENSEYSLDAKNGYRNGEFDRDIFLCVLNSNEIEKDKKLSTIEKLQAVREHNDYTSDFWSLFDVVENTKYTPHGMTLFVLGIPLIPIVLIIEMPRQLYYIPRYIQAKKIGVSL